jgi:hypothetical protein
MVRAEGTSGRRGVVMGALLADPSTPFWGKIEGMVDS